MPMAAGAMIRFTALLTEGATSEVLVGIDPVLAVDFCWVGKLFEVELVTSLVALRKDVSNPDGEEEASEKAKCADVEWKVDCERYPVLVFESIGVLGGGGCAHPKNPQWVVQFDRT